MPERINRSQLEAYLEEALPAEEMARIEKAIRKDPELIRRLALERPARRGRPLAGPARQPSSVPPPNPQGGAWQPANPS